MPSAPEDPGRLYSYLLQRRELAACQAPVDFILLHLCSDDDDDDCKKRKGSMPRRPLLASRHRDAPLLQPLLAVGVPGKRARVAERDAAAAAAEEAAE
ncbi:hypothetical protein LLEC1_02860 [Akanthomyces lecanii]|uniref:Uncharacterized protein n=1 Tax=Cordyceps confragosa TaxID=2714763 RepID=A0A179I2B8_CORDF|nr:hypothetical protein LLEC1_02860 [Akanthomyces lecanii]